jgi:hypothetical protein
MRVEGVKRELTPCLRLMRLVPLAGAGGRRVEHGGGLGWLACRAAR